MKDTNRGLTELIGQATSRGAAASEALLVTEQTYSVDVRRGRIESSRQVEGSIWTLRCWMPEGRTAFRQGSYDEVYNGISSLLEEVARGEPVSHAGPVGRLPTSSTGLSILDRRYAHLGEADRHELVVRTERDARVSDRRISTGLFSYEDVFSQRGYLNSRGISLTETSTSYGIQGRVEVISGSERFELVDSQHGRGFSDVATLPLGKRFASRAGRLLKRGGRIPDQVPVILSPRATAALIEVLARCFTVDNLAVADRFFLNSVEGVSDTLHLLDDGAAPGGMRTRAFDDRGVSSVPLTLLKDGKIGGRFLAPEEARAFSTRPTGHCWQGKNKPTNLILCQGTRSLNAIMTERGDRAFWIDDIPDLSGLDIRTGELRAVVSGVVLNGSDFEGACRNVVMTGNLATVLQQVVHVFSNTDRVRHVDAPALMVEGFNFIT